MIIDQLFTRPIFEAADPSRLIATITLSQAYNADEPTKEVDLTGRFQGDVKSQMNQAADYLTQFLQSKGFNFTSIQLKYQGMVMNAQNRGSMTPQSDWEKEAEATANQMRAKRPVQNTAPALKEFAPSDDGDGPNQEELLRRLAAHWWNGNERQMAKVENTLAAMGWEIGQDEGYDDGGVFVVRAGDEHGRTYTSWSADELEINKGMDEGRKRKKKKTSRSLGRYFFPGFGYYGSGESGEGGGDGGGGESAKPGMAEGIRVVDQDYDLDQIVLTLDIEGKRASFTYTDYDENFKNAERKDVFDQLQEKSWYATLDHHTKMEILDAAYRAIRGLEPQEYRPTVGDEPLDEQGVAEGSEQKPAITYKDYTLQYDYQTEDDDPEGYSTATTYYFDVLKDGDRVGEAEYFDYFGNLTIRINGKTKEFGFRHPLASQISQLVSSLPDEQKKDLSDPRFESQDLTEVFADQGSGSTDRDNADYMKRRRAAKKKGYTSRETKAGTWRVFKDGNAVAVAGPFKSADEAAAWIKKHKQGVTEMDKSEPSAGRDGSPRPGPDKEAKPITAKKATRDAGRMLNRAVKDSHKKDVKESDPLMLKLERAMVREGRVKELALDLKTMPDADFMKKYGKAKAAIRADMKRVDEATPAMPATPAAPAKPVPQSNRQYAKTYNAATKQSTTNAPAANPMGNDPAQRAKNLQAAQAQAAQPDADEYNFDSWEQDGNMAVPLKNGVRQGNLFAMPVSQLPPGTKIVPRYTTYQQDGNSAYPVDANGGIQQLAKIPLSQVPKGAKIVQMPNPGGNLYKDLPGAQPAAAKPSTPTAQPAGAPVNELSTNKLAQYKTAAAKDAKRSDQAGDFKRGDKRFHGIVKATKKQFDNDAKKVDESRAARRALMARIVNGN